MSHVVSSNTKMSGFTLIELMLAMTFISVLLLAIALTVIQIGNIYNKGITVKDLNQSSRDIADDIGRSAGEAPTLNVATDLRQNSAGGRLCLGNYSYIWNTAEAVEENTDDNITRYERDEAKELRFVKVPDSSKIYCALDSTDALTYPQIRDIDTEKTQDLLPGGDHKLGINRFTIDETTGVNDTTTKQGIYTLDYTLSSGKVAAMTDDRTGCRVPPDPLADLTYCTVQQFSLVLRTGNKV